MSVGLRNHSYRKMTVQAKSIVAKVSAANIVPHSFAPNLENNGRITQRNQKVPTATGTGNSDIETPTVDTPPALTPEKEKLLFSKIDLFGTKDLDPDLIEET